jgi:uncharacterized membrane protein
LGRKLPVWPMLTTTVAAAAINFLLAYALAQLVAGDRVPDLGVVVPALVSALAAVCAAAAFVGWRDYLRRRPR